MSAKKTPEELAANCPLAVLCYDDKEQIVSQQNINEAWSKGVHAGYLAGQANPTPEAIEKLMPSVSDVEEFIDKKRGYWPTIYWLMSELKRRAGGGK